MTKKNQYMYLSALATHYHSQNSFPVFTTLNKRLFNFVTTMKWSSRQRIIPCRTITSTTLCALDKFSSGLIIKKPIVGQSMWPSIHNYPGGPLTINSGLPRWAVLPLPRWWRKKPYPTYLIKSNIWVIKCLLSSPSRVGNNQTPTNALDSITGSSITDCQHALETCQEL